MAERPSSKSAKRPPAPTRPLAARRPTLAELTARRPGFRLRARLVIGLLVGGPLVTLADLFLSGAIDLASLTSNRGIEVAAILYILCGALILRQLGAAAADLDAGVRGQEDAAAHGARVGRALAAWTDAAPGADPTPLAKALEQPPQRLALDRVMISLLAAYRARAPNAALDVELQEVGLVLAPSRALTDLVTALLDAAVAASPYGESVMVSLEDAGAAARLRVADRGVGKPAAKPMDQVLAVALGGELGAEPRAEGGRIITLTLPSL